VFYTILCENRSDLTIHKQPNIYETISKNNTDILVTKRKSIRKLFKSKTSLGQPNSGNQLQDVHTYKTFAMTYSCIRQVTPSPSTAIALSRDSWHNPSSNFPSSELRLTSLQQSINDDEHLL
jgi:hypothetical protein